jgi:hypothetical protein
MIARIKFFLGRKIRYLIFILRIPYSYYIDYILQFLKYSNWIKKNKHQLIANFSERNDLYIFLNKKIIKNQSIDYLEFGVADGSSFRQWYRTGSEGWGAKVPVREGKNPDLPLRSPNLG